MATQTGSIDFKSTKGFQSYASGQYTTKTEFDNLEIGGRNRILNTLNPSASKLPTPVGLSWGGTSSGALEFSDGVTKFTSTSTSGEHFIRLNSPSHASHALESMGIPYPCDMVFSGYYKCSFSDSAARLTVRVQNSNGTSWLNQLPLTNLLTGQVEEGGIIQINTSSSVDEWSRFEVKITVPEGVVVASAYFSFQYYATPFATGDTFEIKLMKLEKGNKATDWTPAPEDLDAHFESVETAIEQNAEAIKLSATKEEVEKTYSTKDESKLDNSGSGSLVPISGAANASLKNLHILGESAQDGTPTPSAPVSIVSVAPANLIRYEAWKNRTYTVDRGTGVFENGGITITATANDCYTNVSTFPAEARIPVNEGETVFLIWESPDAVSGYVYIFGNGGTTSMAYRDNLQARCVTYDVPSGVSYITFRFGVATAGTTIRYQNIRITKGRPLSFAPSDSIGILTRGKNLLHLPPYPTTTRNGLTFSLDSETGTISVSGTATASNTDLGINLSESINVPDGTAVTLSFHGTISSGGMTAFLYDGTYFEYHGLGSNSITFTQAGGRVVRGILLRWNPAYGAQNINAQMQLEFGSEATEYEPYSGTVVPIPMNGNELRGLPDGTQDELTVDTDGHVTMTQRVGSVENVGDKISASAQVYTVRGLKCVPYTPDNYAVSSRPSALAAMITTGTVKSSSQVTTGDVYMNPANIMFMGDADDTATDIKTLYASATLTYPLATPKTIDLGTIDMPQVKDGDTVEVIAALTPSIDATWWASAGQAVADAYASLSSAIEVRAESIVSTVSERYATSDEVRAISSQIEQTAQGWGIQFKNLLGTPTEGQSTEGMTLAKAFEQLGVTKGNLEQIRSYVRIAEETVDNQTYPVLLMGAATSPIMLALSNKALEFRQGDTKVAWIEVVTEDLDGDGVKEHVKESLFHIEKGVVDKELQFGSWKWFERDGVGNLALKWVGDE